MVYKPGYIHIDYTGQKWIKLANGGWLRVSYIKDVKLKNKGDSC